MEKEECSGSLLIFQNSGAVKRKKVIITTTIYKPRNPQKTYCGLNYAQLSNVLTTMSALEDLADNLTEEEHTAFDVSLQCVTEVMNRMKDGKPIEYGEV